ncbi:MAG: chemotaxis protein CheW [Gammaproteobacteria bacterium]|jgi:twitching motility protein PilI|nr:chemotaxis protein CheW [Gammaproteobacteria bacterium]
MSSAESRKVIELLYGMQQRAMRLAAGLPILEAVREEWVGIAFQLRQHTLLAPMTEVKEVITPPSLSQIPHIKTWVKGIANMRGNLLPVIDLQLMLFGNALAADPKNQRVIVVDLEGISTGLLVDSVQGLNHFWADEVRGPPAGLEPALQPFVQQSFASDDGNFGVFGLMSLVYSEAFLDAAV